MEGLLFGGAYVQREICVSKLIGLACSGKEIHHFCSVYLYWTAHSKFWRDDLMEGFSRYDFGGLIWAYTWGAYNFQNFTVKNILINRIDFTVLL